MRTAEIVQQAALRDGVIRAATLILLGASRADVRRACRSGALLRIREGVYGILGCHPLIWAAALHGGALACAPALRLRGVWLLDDAARLHVWLGDGGKALTHDGCRCVSHYDRGRAALGSVSVVQALVQLASCLGDEVFFAAFESAWRKGLLSASGRAEVRAGLPAHQRRLVDLARPDADSGLESILRLRLLRLGIRLECQVRIAGVGIVDFLLDGILILEVDGRDNHEGASLRHKDLVRDAAAAARGFDTLRFDYSLVIHQWEIVERAILERRRLVGSALSRRTRR